MNFSLFKTVGQAISVAEPFLSSSTVINLTSAVLEALPESTPIDPKDALLLAAVKSDLIRDLLRESLHIRAIKELRALTNCSLLDAKNTIDFLRGV